MSLFGFPIQVRDIIDILLVTILLFETYRLLKNYGAATVFHGILVFFMTWFFVVFVFRLPLLGSILNNVISVGALAIVIIFQEEIRMFFSRFGSRTSRRWVKRLSELLRLRRGEQADDGDVSKLVLPVVMACKNMARTKTGADERRKPRTTNSRKRRHWRLAANRTPTNAARPKWWRSAPMCWSATWCASRTTRRNGWPS